MRKRGYTVDKYFSQKLFVRDQFFFLETTAPAPASASRPNTVPAAAPVLELLFSVASLAADEAEAVVVVVV